MSSNFDALVSEAESSPIVGWDSTRMNGRWISRPPPWDYRRLVRARLRRVDSLLDLGTGGGEFLSSLAPLPGRTFATEGYLPNLPVARERLEPLGVWVLPIGSNNRIDLPTGSVQLILSRHEEFDADEVYRVLQPGGRFITQQVGARNYWEINDRLGIPPAPPTNALGAARELAAEISSSGLKLKQVREARFMDQFKDVGALVWYLRWAPWQAPKFSVKKYRDRLHSIHRTIRRSGGFKVTARRMLVVADKG
jgi:SAM-dependent methyltransferase